MPSTPSRDFIARTRNPDMAEEAITAAWPYEPLPRDPAAIDINALDLAERRAKGKGVRCG